MPIPSSMADLSTTAASNSPAGTDSPTSGDDYLRSIQAIIRSTNAKGADIASASTTDIGAATGEFVDVTGTTTITGLGTIAAGIVRTVRFTGALTLTHNATSLQLPGGANITTANGDTAVFRSLGSGNWKCINYTKASGLAVVSSLSDGDKGDITVSASGATWTIDNDAITTAKIINDAVTYAKMQNISATSRILGRKTAAAGDTEECTLSEILDFIGSAAQGDILYRDAAGWARLGAGTSGQFLKTQGAAANPAWADVSTGGFTALGSLTTTSGQTQTLSGLDLTSYKLVMVLFFGVSTTSTNSIKLGTADLTSPATIAVNVYGCGWLDLATGNVAFSGTGTGSTGGATGYSTATTSLVFDADGGGTGTFDAGSIKVYGVK